MDFRAVFEQEFAFVSRTLRRLGVRESECDDVAHEVFLRVHERLRDFDASRPLRPWIFGFALRCAAEHRRLARHRVEIVGLPADPVDPAPSPDDAAAVRDDRDLLSRALDRVAIERRAVLLLHDVEGASAPEISAALGIPLNTVYSRLRVARRELSAAVRRLQRSRDDLSPAMLLPALYGAAGDGGKSMRRGWIARAFATWPMSSAGVSLALGVALGAGGYAAFAHPQIQTRTVYVERRQVPEAPAPGMTSAPASVEAPPAATTATPDPPPLAPSATRFASAGAPPVSASPAAIAPEPLPIADRDSALAAEQRILDEARAALAHADPAAAAALLERHARQFPRALLGEEHEALAIEALAASGRRDEARVALARFRSRYPNSLFSSALRPIAESP